MVMILMCTLAFALVGGAIGGMIKFFQWVLADLTFCFFFNKPTGSSVLVMIVQFAFVGGIIGLITALYTGWKENKNGMKWILEDNIFEFSKVFNECHYQRKAYERLIVQFPQLQGIAADSIEGPWQVEWFKEADKPYVLVMNVLDNNKLIRKEWYEYYKGEWHYKGYLSREKCIQHYRWADWERNKNAFRDIKEFDEWLSEPDHKHYRISDEKAARRILDDYFSNYTFWGVKK